MTATGPRTNPVAGLLRGAGLLIRGAGLMLRRRRLFGLGMIPPLITSVVFVTALISLAWASPSLASWATPFAEGWPSVEAVRTVVAVLIVLTGGVVVILLFTSATLALGAPLYDRISQAVDDAEGPYPEVPGDGVVRGLVRDLGNAVLGLALALPVGLGLLLLGLIPVVGAPVAAIGSAAFGAWMIALDLTGSAAGRRGVLTFSARGALLARDRWLVLGFGIPAFLLMSLPGIAVLAFPIVLAGGTLLARRLSPDTAA